MTLRADYLLVNNNRSKPSESIKKRKYIFFLNEVLKSTPKTSNTVKKNEFEKRNDITRFSELSKIVKSFVMVQEMDDRTFRARTGVQLYTRIILHNTWRRHYNARVNPVGIACLVKHNFSLFSFQRCVSFSFDGAFFGFEY